MRFLNCGAYRACLKACLGVIRNLALKPQNHQILREKGVMNEVLRLFSAYIQRGLVRSQGFFLQAVCMNFTNSCFVGTKWSRRR